MKVRTRWLTERFALSENSKIDRENRIIHDVVLINAKSENKRRFTDKALDDFARLSEGLKFYVNHPDDPSKPRKYEELAGRLHGIRREKERVVASELRLLDPWAEMIMDRTEADPEHAGCSYNYKAKVTKASDGWEEILEVPFVRSSDLVTEPATTESLFETRNLEEEKMEVLIEELRKLLNMKEGASEEEMIQKLREALDEGRIKAALGRILALIQGDRKDEAIKQIKSILDAMGASSYGYPGLGYGSPEKEALEMEKKQLEDRVKQLENELNEKKKELDETKLKLDTFETEKRIEAKKVKIAEIMEAAKLPKEGRTKIFEKHLLTIEDEAEIKQLIEDRASMMKFGSGKPRGMGGEKGNQDIEPPPKETFLSAFGAR
jgi:hypothetical protein